MAGDPESEQQQSDFDKSSTIPRNSDITQSYRRMFQAKRPASTAGLPSSQVPYPGPGAYHTGPYPPTPIHTGAYASTPTAQYPPTPTGNCFGHFLNVGDKISWPSVPKMPLFAFLQATVQLLWPLELPRSAARLHLNLLDAVRAPLQVPAPFPFALLSFL